VPRALSTALVLALLGATTVAFVVTERLKLKPSPITKVFVTKIFSPTCECDTNLATIRFRLRKAGRLTLAIVDADHKLVQTLVGPAAQKQGRVAATWDGQSEAGAVVPDGAYQARIQLDYRTIFMPNRIHVDTTPPVVKLLSVTPHVLEPGKAVRVRYVLDEPARVIVFLNGKLALRGRSMRTKWKLEWEPRVKPGKYDVTLTARDRAGNLSNASRSVVVIAPLRLVTHRVRAVAGSRFAVRLRSDGRAYRWSIGARAGSGSARRLRLRAPARPGRYRLVITQDGLRHVVTLVVPRAANGPR
jgi:hypothetical protein